MNEVISTLTKFNTPVISKYDNLFLIFVFLRLLIFLPALRQGVRGISDDGSMIKSQDVSVFKFVDPSSTEGPNP